MKFPFNTWKSRRNKCSSSYWQVLWIMQFLVHNFKFHGSSLVIIDLTSSKWNFRHRTRICMCLLLILPSFSYQLKAICSVTFQVLVSPGCSLTNKNPYSHYTNDSLKVIDFLKWEFHSSTWKSRRNKFSSTSLNYAFSCSQV